MNKFFILAVLFAVAVVAKVPKTYKECRSDFKKLKVTCKDCAEGKEESKKCKKSAKVAGSDCAILKNCFSNVDKRNKKKDKKAAKKLSEKYGKLCPADRRQCVDRIGSCPSWANRVPSECERNPDFMLSNCPNSCCPLCTGRNTLRIGVCPKKDREDLCVPNDHASCHQWANPGKNKKSECKKNRKWMRLHCMQSCCEACKRDAYKCPTVRDDCKNKYKKPNKKKGDAACLAWAQNGECQTNPNWMNKNCAKECCPICRAYQPGQGQIINPYQPVVQRQPQFVFGGYRSG